jgi:hypothetical protein
MTPSSPTMRTPRATPCGAADERALGGERPLRHRDDADHGHEVIGEGGSDPGSMSNRQPVAMPGPLSPGLPTSGLHCCSVPVHNMPVTPASPRSQRPAVAVLLVCQGARSDRDATTCRGIGFAAGLKIRRAGRRTRPVALGCSAAGPSVANHGWTTSPARHLLRTGMQGPSRAAQRSHVVHLAARRCRSPSRPESGRWRAV